MLGLLGRQKWLVVACTLAVTAAAVGVSLLTPRAYQGTARVLIYDKSRVAVQDQRAMVTELELVKNPDFAVKAVSSLHLAESPSQVLSRVSASVVGDTNIITISATAGDPKRAADIANAVAAGFADWSNARQRENLKSQADAAEQQAQETAKTVIKLQSTMRSMITTDGFLALIADNTALRAITQKANDLRVSQRSQANAVQVAIPAQPDGRPVAPKTQRNAVLGLVIGVILGLGAAVVREHLPGGHAASKSAGESCEAA